MKLQHQRILEAARRLKVQIKDVSQEFNIDTAILTKNDKSELFVEGTPTSLLTVRSQYYCDNKQLTKQALQAVSIPHPKSILFRSFSKELAAFFEVGQSYVCKPVDRSNGEGVEMNIQSLAAVEQYYQQHRHLNTTFMLEEQIEGKDLRIQVIGGTIVAACTRKPAYVVGNGAFDLQTLIDQHRSKVQQHNPANELDIDEKSLQLLAKQKVSLTDIIEKGRVIKLKQVANMSQGAIPIDLTDDLHSIFQTWVSKIAAYLGTGYMGIDIIASDHQNPDLDRAWVLEINARPEWLHHTFSEGKQHDIPTIIIRHLFDL